MVSAELLAQLEQRCREIMRDLSLAKFGEDGAVEPFGGLNVILAGDLYQLPPPKGTFLGGCSLGLVNREEMNQTKYRIARSNAAVGRAGSGDARRH